MKIIGITGSFGKTTTAFLLYQYMKKIKVSCGICSSLMISFSTENIDRKNNVDIPIKSKEQVNQLIDYSIKNNIEYLILEINEITIKKKYISDINFDIIVSTGIKEKHNEILYPDYVKLKKSFIKKPAHHHIIAVYEDSDINIINELDNPIIVTTNYIRNVKKIEEVKYVISGYNNSFDSIQGINFYLNDILIKTSLLMPYSAVNLGIVVAILSEEKIFNSEAFLPLVKDCSIEGRNEVINFKGNKIIITKSISPLLEVLSRYQERKEINKKIILTSVKGYEFISLKKEFSKEVLKKEKEESVKYAASYISKYADEIIITDGGSASLEFDNLLKLQDEEYYKKGREVKVITTRSTAIKEAISRLDSKDVLIINGRGEEEIFFKSYDRIETYKDSDIVKEYIKCI